MKRPRVFFEGGFDSGRREALARGKLLLVDATAAWCGPCQVMDRTTWSDPAVVERLDRYAVAIQFDVDDQPELKQQLRIQSMPTVLAFRDGVEIDRMVGLQASDQFIAWLEALERGETSLNLLRNQANFSPTDMSARMAFARKLLEVGDFDGATTEFVWLWQHMLEHDPAMVGVRHSFLVRDIERLVLKHEPAREAFAHLRDAAAPSMEGEPTREDLNDWFSLNEILGETDKSLAWFDAERTRLNLEGELALLLERRVVPMLVHMDRWADIALLYPNPLATLRLRGADRTRDLGPDCPADVAAAFRAYADGELRRVAGVLVRALNAAGRSGEARSVVEEARRLDCSKAMESALLGEDEDE